MLRSPKVLLAAPNDAETTCLEDILSKHARVTCVQDLSELASVLEREHYDALFCSWSLDEANWNDVLEEVQEIHPNLPVIVVSSSAEDRDWLEVLDAGAFDLLAPPYEEGTVTALLEQASSSYQAPEPARHEPRFRMRA